MSVENFKFGGDFFEGPKDLSRFGDVVVDNKYEQVVSPAQFMSFLGSQPGMNRNLMLLMAYMTLSLSEQEFQQASLEDHDEEPEDWELDVEKFMEGNHDDIFAVVDMSPEQNGSDMVEVDEDEYFEYLDGEEADSLWGDELFSAEDGGFLAEGTGEKDTELDNALELSREINKKAMRESKRLKPQTQWDEEDDDDDNASGELQMG